MKQVANPRLIASTNTLTVSGSVSVGGGVHQTFLYRFRLKDLRDEDVVLLCEQMGMEVGRRVRERWDDLDTQSPIW